MKRIVYVLFLVTGVFCLYVIVLFFRGAFSDESLDPSVEVPPSDSEEIASEDTGSVPIKIDLGENQEAPGGQSNIVDKKLQEFEKAILDFQSKVDEQHVPIHENITNSLIGEYEVSPLEAGDIFGFYIFGELEFSTYSTGTARIYAFVDPYYIIERNMKLLDTYFTYNETNTFFDKSFFLNAKEDDGIVRFVFEYEGAAYGVEILRSEYEGFKRLLLQ